MSTTAQPERRIQFLARDLPLPTNPTYREYRVVEELTGVTGQAIMEGTAGLWMLPVLAIVALMRSDKNVTHATLDKILDLGPHEINVTGITMDDDETEEDGPPADAVETAAETGSTGTKSTRVTRAKSGTPDSPTTSQEQPEGPTT